MQKHLRILAVSLCVSGFSYPLAAEDTPDAEAIGPETVVATVDGQDITIGHMIAARATLPEQYDQAPPQMIYDGLLRQLVQQTALANKIESLPPLVELTLENEERSLKAGQVIDSELKTAVTEEDIQAAFDAQYADFDPQEEFNASHILVETEEEALAIKTSLDEGGDFSATARESSIGPSGPNGGQLGWFGTGMMVPSFEAATIALEVGEISAPVQTQFGWHIILLNDTRKETIPALDDVRDQITQQLRNQAVQEIIENAPNDSAVIIPELTGVDPAILTQVELLEQ